MSYFGKYPAKIASYDRLQRICKVSIPGLTDGSSELPEAQFCYPIGDKSEHTEIRVLPGDRVWVEFLGGDPRYPIIVGWRPKQKGNEPSVEWRRWHHENFQRESDLDMMETVGRDMLMTMGRNWTANVQQNLSFEAGQSITFKVGSSTLLIESGEVTLTTPQFTGVQS